MSSVTVKRARVTARIAEAENTSLPTSSEITQQLLEQTEEKRKQLDKKCSDYEQVCKKVTRLKAERSKLETENANLSAQSDETDQMFGKLEHNAETSFLMQQQKNNEMNEAVQKWTSLDGKEEKLYANLIHETELEKELSRKSDKISKAVEEYGINAEASEHECRQLEAAFENDLKTEKTLEQYLTRLIDDVFINQRRLEDIRIGTSRGRADFRQAEKALRDQRKRNGKLSAQINGSTMSETNNDAVETINDEEKERLDQLETAWEQLEDKIRLKEFELSEESEKLNQNLKKMEDEQFSAAERIEKQQQSKIAQDYANLQSLTPMYVAYTAALKLNDNLTESLEVSSHKTSVVNESRGSNSIQKSESSVKSIEFVDDTDDLPEYSEMRGSRKKILCATENEAQRVLTNELKELEGIVSGQRQECLAIEKDVTSLKEAIQLRQSDIQFYDSKTKQLIQKALQEDEQKLHLSKQKSQKGEASPHIQLASRSDVSELREQIIILENERNLLTNQIKENSLECDRLNGQWKILKGFAKSVNFDLIRQMTSEIDTWRVKVDQLEDQIKKLQRMENTASLANGQLRTNLAILKPYDEEYQEYENLLEANKRLNNELSRSEFRRNVEELKKSGDIDVLSLS